MMADIGMSAVISVMARFAKAALALRAHGQSPCCLSQRLGQFVAEQGKVTLYAARPPDQHMIGTGFAAGEDQCARQAAKPALHPVANDGIANFFGDSDAKPDRRIAVFPVTDEQDEPWISESPRRIRREKITALLDAG